MCLDGSYQGLRRQFLGDDLFCRERTFGGRGLLDDLAKHMTTRCLSTTGKEKKPTTSRGFVGEESCGECEARGFDAGSRIYF
jgi:hypothetical protein